MLLKMMPTPPQYFSVGVAVVGERELLVLGHFGMAPDSPEMECLRKEKLSALLAPSVFTNISTRTPQGSHCLDNIWASRSLKKIYTGGWCRI